MQGAGVDGVAFSQCDSSSVPDLISTGHRALEVAMPIEIIDRSIRSSIRDPAVLRNEGVRSLVRSLGESFHPIDLLLDPIDKGESPWVCRALNLLDSTPLCQRRTLQAT